MTRFLIADDHEVVRFGLRSMIEKRADWEVVAEAADGREVILKAVETRPGVAVVYDSLPLMNGIDVTHQLESALRVQSFSSSRWIAAKALNNGRSKQERRVCFLSPTPSMMCLEASRGLPHVSIPRSLTVDRNHSPRAPAKITASSPARARSGSIDC